jgi:hypothetical protein
MPPAQWRLTQGLAHVLQAPGYEKVLLRGARILAASLCLKWGRRSAARVPAAVFSKRATMSRKTSSK